MDRLLSAGLLLLLLAVVSIPAQTVLGVILDRRALKADWTISGPDCPIVSAPSIQVRSHKPPLQFDYGGAHFTSQFGAVSCEALPEDGVLNRTTYHVCQFAGPGVVTVRTARGSVIFEPGIGRPVSITVSRARASCVLGGWFRG